MSKWHFLTITYYIKTQRHGVHRERKHRELIYLDNVKLVSNQNKVHIGTDTQVCPYTQ